MYQKIEMADMNQIQEWMERFALTFWKRIIQGKRQQQKREARPEQETVKNEESLQKAPGQKNRNRMNSLRRRWRPLRNCRMASRRNRWNCRKKYSLFEPEQPKEQDLQDTQELQIEITQPVERKSDENPAGQIAQESEELPMEDDETEDIEGFSLESDGGEDDGDEFEEEPSDISGFWSDRSNVKKYSSLPFRV